MSLCGKREFKGHVDAHSALFKIERPVYAYSEPLYTSNKVRYMPGTVGVVSFWMYAEGPKHFGHDSLLDKAVTDGKVSDAGSI